ncbi:MAG: protease pro-enzyme activation domain-containing protein [Candidatus Korobacteraceae bacterium]
MLITIPGKAQQALQVLHKHVRPVVTSGRALPVGSLPSTQYLNLVIHLPVRNQDELTSLINRLSDPTSPDYRHWLSVAEFTERFGRTEAEYRKVADFAAANGFAVTYKSPNRLMLVVRGSVAQVEAAFNVEMKIYQVPGENRIFYSPDREPSFALDVPVSHISGLNNYSYPHPGAGPRPAELGAGGPDAEGTGSGPASSFLGSDMRAAYNMGSNTGAGQTVGLVEFSGYTASDVSLYFSSIHQTNNVPIANIVVDGGSPTNWTDPDAEGEVCLDIQQAVSVAPGLTQLRVYIGPNSFGSGVDGYIFSRMATDNIAKQLSNSWYWYPDDPAIDDPYFEEMATQGQTLFTASGDYGAYTGNEDEDGSYPAEDVHLTVVGGTELTTSGPGGPWQSEVAWNDDGAGSGGGPADDGTRYFPIQSWQVPVINSSNGGSTTLRNSPDVALQANYDNYICYDAGVCQTHWGGTSFATPRWAAWLALVNQQLVASGDAAGLGFINPTLYSIGQSSSYNSDFHDITIGNNDTDGQLRFYYAVVGYDLVTGWGSMNGRPLMTALVPYTLTVSTIGNGSVTSTDGLINCPGTCSRSYPGNTQVTLNAAPIQGWMFSGWSGACSGTGSCVVAMTQNQSVTATFTQNSYTLTVSTVGNGAVTSTDGFINCPGTCSHIYQSLELVTLDAAPAQGWSLSGWTGACSGVGPCNVAMTQNLSVTAVFLQPPPGYGLQFVLVTPCRLVDTRQTGNPIQGGTSQDFTIPQLGGCGIPTSAAAYSLNVTVVPQGPLGYLTIWPTGEAQPYVSTMNSYDGRIKANAAIVPAGTSGAVSVYVTDTTNIILDIDGYFTPPGQNTYQFYTVAPCRIVDTRGGQDGGTLQAGVERDYLIAGNCGVPPSATAYSFNVTALPATGGLDYLTVWPQGESQPNVSTLNDDTGTVVANAAIVPAGMNNTTAFCAHNNNTDLLVDVNGYFAAPGGTSALSLYPAAPCRVLDTRQNNGQPFMGLWDPPNGVDVLTSPCAPPSSSQAYVFNATVVPSGSMPYLTLWPHGTTQPLVSMLNAYDGFITSNMAIVPTSDGSIDAYAAGLTQLIIDISGYFAQ